LTPDDLTHRPNLLAGQRILTTGGTEYREARRGGSPAARRLT